MLAKSASNNKGQEEEEEEAKFASNNKGQEEEGMSTLEVVVDDEARIRILHPDAHAQSCLVQHSCSTFQSKLHDFHTVKKKSKNFIH
jgi:hypothetical protein